MGPRWGPGPPRRRNEIQPAIFIVLFFSDLAVVAAVFFYFWENFSLQRETQEKEESILPNGRPEIGPHSKTEEETEWNTGMGLP